LLSYYTDDGIRLPDQAKAAMSKDALRELQMRELKENVKIQSFKELDKNVYVCGDYIFETGKVVISFSKENTRFLLSDWINYVTIWNKRPDGSLKIKLDATSPAVIPEGGNIPEADGFVMVKVKSDSGLSEDMNAVYEKIKKYENEFHHKFIERDSEGAAGFYVDDAILMPWRQNAMKGKKEITEFIREDMAKSPLVDMTVDVAHIEGNNKIVYAANIFTWTFKDSSSGQDVTFPGKGVHVWSRQEDGSWKILFDLNNVSVPISGN
jgi:ketosteroid isomerase-like protein